MSKHRCFVNTFAWVRNIAPWEAIEEGEGIRIGMPQSYDGMAWPELISRGWKGLYEKCSVGGSHD